MKKKYKLDKEERELLKFLEKGEWIAVKDKEDRLKRYAQHAKDTVKKIPKFKSEKEEAKFWDSHSPLDYSDEFVDVEKPMEISPALIEKILAKKK